MTIQILLKLLLFPWRYRSIVASDDLFTTIVIGSPRDIEALFPLLRERHFKHVEVEELTTQ